MPKQSCVILEGAFYNDVTWPIAIATSKTKAVAWLKKHGYTKTKEPNSDLFEIERGEEWYYAQVLPAPLVG